ncbi:hypothetical protein PV326_013430 [Microctonus aethiopoides]|nr:hypothetical protein PV326_013430 [Microctonus aethiopoides]
MNLNTFFGKLTPTIEKTWTHMYGTKKYDLSREEYHEMLSINPRPGTFTNLEERNQLYTPDEKYSRLVIDIDSEKNINIENENNDRDNERMDSLSCSSTFSLQSSSSSSSSSLPTITPPSLSRLKNLNIKKFILILSKELCKILPATYYGLVFKCNDRYHIHILNILCEGKEIMKNIKLQLAKHYSCIDIQGGQNHFLMHGSLKKRPNNYRNTPYLLYKVFKISPEEIIIENDTYGIKKWPQSYQMKNLFQLLSLRREKNDQDICIDKKHTEISINKQLKRKNFEMEDEKGKKITKKKCLMCNTHEQGKNKCFDNFILSVSEKYSESYSDWISIAFVIINHYGDNYRGLSLFKTFSKICISKYNSGECENKYSELLKIFDYSKSPPLVNYIQNKLTKDELNLKNIILSQINSSNFHKIVEVISQLIIKKFNIIQLDNSTTTTSNDILIYKDEIEEKIDKCNDRFAKLLMINLNSIAPKKKISNHALVFQHGYYYNLMDYKYYKWNKDIVATAYIESNPNETTSDDIQKITRLIESWFNNDEQTIIYIYNILLSTLVSGNHIDRAIYILYGEGRNGKSLFLKILQNLFGNNSLAIVVPDTDLTMTKSISATFKHCRGDEKVAIISDFDFAKINSDGWTLLKHTSGGDNTAIRVPYGKENQKLKLNCKFFMATNIRPYIPPERLELNDRLRFIPFLHRYNVKDMNKRLFNESIIKNMASALMSKLLFIWQKKKMTPDKLLSLEFASTIEPLPYSVKLLKTINDAADPIKHFITTKTRKGNSFISLKKMDEISHITPLLDDIIYLFGIKSHYEIYKFPFNIEISPDSALYIFYKDAFQQIGIYFDEMSILLILNNSPLDAFDKSIDFVADLKLKCGDIEIKLGQCFCPIGPFLSDGRKILSDIIIDGKQKSFNLLRSIISDYIYTKPIQKKNIATSNLLWYNPKGETIPQDMREIIITQMKSFHNGLYSSELEIGCNIEKIMPFHLLNKPKSLQVIDETKQSFSNIIKLMKRKYELTMQGKLYITNTNSPKYIYINTPSMFFIEYLNKCKEKSIRLTKYKNYEYKFNTLIDRCDLFRMKRMLKSGKKNFCSKSDRNWNNESFTPSSETENPFTLVISGYRTIPCMKTNGANLIRQIHPHSFGFMCPHFTPDSESVGMIQYLLPHVKISKNESEIKINNMMEKILKELQIIQYTMKETDEDNGDIEDENVCVYLSWGLAGFLYKKLTINNNNESREIITSHTNYIWQKLWKIDCDNIDNIFSTNAIIHKYYRYNDGPRAIISLGLMKQAITDTTTIVRAGECFVENSEQKKLLITNEENYNNGIRHGVYANVLLLSMPNNVEDGILVRHGFARENLCALQKKNYIIDLTNIDMKFDTFIYKLPLNFIKWTDGIYTLKPNQFIEPLEPVIIKECNAQEKRLFSMKYFPTKSPIINLYKIIVYGKLEPSNYRFHSCHLFENKLRYIFIRETRIILGSKIGTPHGQKGVVTQIIPDHLMPFSLESPHQTVDIIVNPLTLFSRGTIGQLHEACIDNVPPKEEIFYDPELGDVIKSKLEIHRQLVMLQKHDPRDKKHKRTNLDTFCSFTRLPKDGRMSDGSARIGEMEKTAFTQVGNDIQLLKFRNGPEQLVPITICNKCGLYLLNDIIKALHKSECKFNKNLNTTNGYISYSSLLFVQILTQLKKQIYLTINDNK